jgi:hypothetical protein
MLARLHALSAPNEPDTGEPQIQQVSAPVPPTVLQLLPVVQQLKDQVDCGSRRLEGELKDWRTPPVQDMGDGRLLKLALRDIHTILFSIEDDRIRLVPFLKIQKQLQDLRNNLYLQQTYRAVAKNMTKVDHDYNIAEFPFVASWSPAIVLFHSKHPTQQWQPLSTLFARICQLCAVPLQ